MAFLDEIGKDMSRVRISNVNVRRGSQREAAPQFPDPHDNPAALGANGEVQDPVSIRFANAPQPSADCCADIALFNERRAAEADQRPPPLSPTPAGHGGPLDRPLDLSPATRGRIHLWTRSPTTAALLSPTSASRHGPRNLTPRSNTSRGLLGSPFAASSPLAATTHPASPGIGKRKPRRDVRPPPRYSPSPPGRRRNTSNDSIASGRSFVSASSRASARSGRRRRQAEISFQSTDMLHTIHEDETVVGDNANVSRHSESQPATAPGGQAGQVVVQALVHDGASSRESDGLPHVNSMELPRGPRAGRTHIRTPSPPPPRRGPRPRVHFSPVIQEAPSDLPENVSPARGRGQRRRRGQGQGLSRAAERQARAAEAERERRQLQLFHEERRAGLRDNIRAQQAALARERPNVQQHDQGPVPAEGAETAMLRQFLTEKDLDVYGAWGQTMACLLRGIRAPVSGKLMVEVHAHINKIVQLDDEAADEYLAEGYNFD
ncbi:serine/arginine repetitive matrix protein 1-like [Thrips palmi]|uniref:Serine/arginine repetitive matrix protein 1-like n=1 Tax=Thrips palmi TaxID=161013 RepID=A0A6P8Z3H5_THRPL|nr:serine/arginine repetitive matrix protein 1-like [Thrips palmi]XP_034244262.1 serine/arginine repetitive matrix protein 1-like [Thrips palmi]